MLLAFALAASLLDWVPARWISNDPKSLDLVSGTPVNCLLLEPAQWSSAFAHEAARRGVATLGVIRSGDGAVEVARQATSLGFSGVVLEGNFDPALAARVRSVLADSKIPLVELPPRYRIQFDSANPILGSYQGVWPGVRVEDNGKVESGPSAAPWIDTNTGFLRFAHAASDSSIWIANQPPANTAVAVTRYLQAIGDASAAGARWVVSLDRDFSRLLLAGDAGALSAWKQITLHLQFYEDHKNWRTYAPHSELAVVEDAASGALLSGGVLDMIAVKHTPVLPVPYRKIAIPYLQGAKMAVDVDPSGLSPVQLAVLKSFTRAGGTLLTGPAGWRFGAGHDETITLDKAELAKIDEIWKEMNSMTGRKNMGARLFNVASMLSNLLESPDRKELVLELVNYSDYPAEDLTVHLTGKFTRARLYRPEAPPIDLEPYPVEDGAGLDIAKIGTVAGVVLQ